MHICMDEVMAALSVLPMVGYCIRCLKARWKARKAVH
jgi:hypothetical protein